MPGLSLARVEGGRRRRFAVPQAGPLIPRQKFPEFRFSVSRPASNKTFEVSPEDGNGTDDDRRPEYAICGAGNDITDARSHEILSYPVADSSGPPAFVAGSHRTQMLEAQFRIIP